MLIRDRCSIEYAHELHNDDEIGFNQFKTQNIQPEEAH